MSLTHDQQVEAYTRMQRIRRFETAGSALWAKGKIPGAYHSSIGQEAAIVGACMALEDDDYMTGTHRSHGHPIGKGADLAALMAELMGKETGVCKGRGGSMHLADRSVGILGESAIVGGGIPLAAGAALSMKVKGSRQVSLAFFGDGAVNQGAFHETMNMAALWKLPVIFLCENNQYAITTPLVKSHAQQSIARRALSYGLPGIEVDGQDIIQVFETTSVAVQRARNGEGPSLIEAKTYRFGEHQVGLNIIGEPYRSAAEVDEYTNQRDPLVIFARHLREWGHTTESLGQIESAVDAQVRAAIEFAEASNDPLPEDLDKYMFSSPHALHALGRSQR